MEVIETKLELRRYINSYKQLSKSIGFVPTMGYLHDGHISLIKQSKLDNDITIVSIFVNPMQFGENEDLSSYPRDFEHDKKLIEETKADIIFIPTVDEMYTGEPLTEVYVKELSDLYCGVTRPIHFKGVTTIIAKFFNIVTPDKAYFGEKDFQQVGIIKKMVKDLDYNIEIVAMPIVRELTGLALSSRNTYLSAEEKVVAESISKSLFNIKNIIETSGFNLKIDNMIAKLSDELIAHNILIEYVKAIDPETLKELKNMQDQVTVIIACRVGKTRLIDNITATIK